MPNNLKLGVISIILIVLGVLGAVLAIEHLGGDERPMVMTAQTSSTSQLDLKGVELCFECHDPEQTMGFHYPEIIMGIEAKKGLRRRICVDCHGPGGVDPDKQMTPSSQIEFIEDKNHFRVNSEAVHSIHLEKLNSEIMMCETCHLIKDGDPTQLGDTLVVPVPNPGDIIVCQMCHLPSDPGNYISIHIISGHQECNTCHTGDLTNIHKLATEKLGRIS